MGSPRKEEAVYVFWGIQMCPVPDGCDARRVGACIKGYLRKLGYTGPITITAVGILTQVPAKTLEAVFSTGISLHSGPFGPTDEMIRLFKEMELSFEGSELGLSALKLGLHLDREGEDPEKVLSEVGSLRSSNQMLFVKTLLRKTR
ncbi:hypothetical protein V5N11_023123 [Cardamine amara subsp. amara]|uniref:NYN domain-containing protein n=1 Tax=Cardamine amara subsp. amara TaxID=228776 RepID=A0ABD0ZP69_CARAN